MPLYSLVDKPVWLNSTQKEATVASAGGWVYTRPDGTAEKLVGISNMTTKMIPVATAVTTDETSYEIGTDTTIEFTVDYNRNIKTAGLTSATTLTFLVDETEYTALYDSMTDNTVTFVYAIPTNGDEYDITETSSIGLDSITLNTGEDLVLDYDDFDIDANLTLPSPITATITQKVPTISSVVSNKASYVLGTDATVAFTVDFTRNIKSSDLTSASVLTFELGDESYNATYTSISGDDAVFTWTIPSPANDIAEDTSITLTEISLNTDEDILLDSATNTISADLTDLPASMNVTFAQKAPAISGVTTDKASYTLGTDTAIIFTVDFDRTIKSSGLTSATVLTFVIGNDSYDATFTSISGDDAVFTWTIPVPTTDVDADTTIDLTAITLNTGEDILLDSTVNTVSAVLTGLPASINVTIVKP